MALSDYVEFRDGTIFYIDLSAKALPVINRLCDEMPEVARAVAASFPEPPPAMGGDETVFHLMSAVLACMELGDGGGLPLLGCFPRAIDPLTTPDFEAVMARRMRAMVPRA